MPFAHSMIEAVPMIEIIPAVAVGFGVLALIIWRQVIQQGRASEAAVRAITETPPDHVWSQPGSATGVHRGRRFGLHEGPFARRLYRRIVFVPTDLPVVRFAAQHQLRSFFETPFGTRVDTQSVPRWMLLTSDEPELLERALRSGLTGNLAAWFEESSVVYVVSIARDDARRVRFGFHAYRGSEPTLLILGRFFGGKAAAAAADPRLDIDALIELEKVLELAPATETDRAAIPAPAALFVWSVLRIVGGVVLALALLAGLVWWLFAVA